MRHTYALMALLALASMPATLAQERFLNDDDEDDSSGEIRITTAPGNEKVNSSESATNSGGFNGLIDSVNIEDLGSDMILCL